MARTVADDLWEMLSQAGVKRVYGIVGDALNPTMDALSKRTDIDFIHVRHEEYGAFAASAEARLRDEPVAVCGTAGPGVTHLLNGLMDAKHERAKVIAIAGDVETGIMDTEALEEISPYDLFRTASLYTARVVNPEQARAVFTTAINTCLTKSGPTVIALPGDVASAKSPAGEPSYLPAFASQGAIPQAAADRIAHAINEADTVAILGGDGCRYAHDAVVELAEKLKAPVGYSYKGKQWLEPDNPYAVGMTGLLGYGGCYDAINDADLLLMLGTDFPFADFLPGKDKTTIIQIDTDPQHLGRRVDVTIGAQGDVGESVRLLLPLLAEKSDRSFADEHLQTTAKWEKKLAAYVEHVDEKKAIRPELVAAMLDTMADDDAMIYADTGTACMWSARNMRARTGRILQGSFSWASMANASPNAFGAKLAAPARQSIALCGDGGFSMLALGDLITESQLGTEVIHIVFNNGMLDFVNIEQQEAGLDPFGTDLPNPDFAAAAEALGATGIRIERVAELRDGLRRALDHRGGPVVVDILVDKYALAVPSHIPAATLKGFTLSAMKQTAHGKLRDFVTEVENNLRLI